MSKSRDEIRNKWRDRVNIAPKELEDWIEIRESRSVGTVTTARAPDSGRRIVEIRRTNKGDLSGDQWDWMTKVDGHITRHCAQVPGGGPTLAVFVFADEPGHDPLKDDGCA